MRVKGIRFCLNAKEWKMCRFGDALGIIVWLWFRGHTLKPICQDWILALSLTSWVTLGLLLSVFELRIPKGIVIVPKTVFWQLSELICLKPFELYLALVSAIQVCMSSGSCDSCGRWSSTSYSSSSLQFHVHCFFSLRYFILKCNIGK